MEYFETAIAFIVGLTLILLLGWVFSLKTKGLSKIAINSVAGAVVLVLLTLFNIIILPLNPLNALIVGFIGIPGIVVVFIFSVYL